MKTIYKSDGATISFILADVHPSYYDAVRGLVYNSTPEGFAKSYPMETPNLERIYSAFARHAEAMVLQAAEVQPVPWKESLSAFLDLTKGQGLEWWLTGSAALAVRGLEIAPRDLDLITSEESAVRLAELLADHLVEPLQDASGWIGRWFGRAFLHARLEWVGGVSSSIDQLQPSDCGPVAAGRLERVHWHGHDIHVPPLDLQLEVSRRRGLKERVATIEAFLGKHPSGMMAGSDARA